MNNCSSWPSWHYFNCSPMSVTNWLLWKLNSIVRYLKIKMMEMQLIYLQFLEFRTDRRRLVSSPRILSISRKIVAMTTFASQIWKLSIAGKKGECNLDIFMHLNVFLVEIWTSILWGVTSDLSYPWKLLMTARMLMRQIFILICQSPSTISRPSYWRSHPREAPHPLFYVHHHPKGMSMFWNVIWVIPWLVIAR